MCCIHADRAATLGHIACLRYLLGGCDTIITDQISRGAAKHINSIKYLIEEKDQKENTILAQGVVSLGNLPYLRHLVEVLCIPNIALLLPVAVSSGRMECLRYVVDKLGPPCYHNVVAHVIECDEVSMLEYLVSELGARVSRKNSRQAAFAKGTKCLRYLAASEIGTYSNSSIRYHFAENGINLSFCRPTKE